jgi:hypothetical protein
MTHTPEPTPPILGDQPKAPWYQRPVGVIALTLIGLGVLGAVFGGNDNQPSTPTVAVAEEQPVVAPGVDLDAGDWDSASEYTLDVLDTTEKMEDILTTFSDAIDLYVGGGATEAEFIVFLSTAVDAVDSHYDYFAGTKAPPVFAATHREFVEALRLYSVAFHQAYDGARSGDVSQVEAATVTLLDAQEAIERATAELAEVNNG